MDFKKNGWQYVVANEERKKRLLKERKARLREDVNNIND